MACIDNMLNKSRTMDIIFHFSIIIGNSQDGSDKDVVKHMHNISRRHENIEITFNNITFPKRLDGLEKLMTLRNVVVDSVNIKKYDYVLSIDTDIIFDNTIVPALVLDIQKLDDAGIIAPMVFIEDFKEFKNRYFYDTFAFRKNGRMFNHHEPYVPGNKSLPSRSFEVDSIGSFYLLRADIFSEYGIKYGTEKRTNIERYPHRILESEQVFFCNEVRKKTPYKIYVEPSLKVFHINLEKYGLEWH